MVASEGLVEIPIVRDKSTCIVAPKTLNRPTEHLVYIFVRVLDW